MFARERERERERECVCDMLETEATITDSLCLCVWRIEKDMYMGALCCVTWRHIYIIRE